MARVQPNRFGRYDQGPTEKQRAIARARITGFLNHRNQNGVLEVGAYENAAGILLQPRQIWRPQDLGETDEARFNTVKTELEAMRQEGVVYYDPDSGFIGLKERRKKREHYQRYPSQRRAA